MSIPGVKIEQFETPVCNCFRPKIVRDQLCYEADPNIFRKNVDNSKLLSFSLVIDYNIDRETADNYHDHNHNDHKPVSEEENLGVIDKLEKEFITLGTIGKYI